MTRFRNWLRIRIAVRASTVTDIPATVQVRLSPGPLEPGVVGLLRPVLLLPEGITERLTPCELAAVLAHELCHIRRRDNLFASVHMFVEAVFWFHPLVWWIGARLVEERERACDEEVLSLGNQPDVYADAILNVCKLYVESPLACVSGVSGASIRRRIETIMSNRRVKGLTRAKKFLLASAGVLALAGPVAIGLVIGIGNAPVIHAQSPAPQIAQTAVAAEPVQIAQAAAAPLPAPASQPPTTARPKFDVASIKPCRAEDIGGGRGGKGGGLKPNSFTPGRLALNCTTVADLIHLAYVSFASGRFNPLSSVPIEGGPAWINSELYTIEASAEGDPGPGTVGGPMLRELLEDRFHLKIRRETKEIPVYELTVAKGGLKMPRFKEGTCVPVDMVKFVAQYPPAGPLPAPPSGLKYCPGARSTMKGPNVTQDFQGSTLDTFIKFFLRDMDRPVIDKTGLTGLFDIHLVFAPDETSDPTLRRGGALEPNEPSDDPAGPSIFTALEQQLGLKLVPAKGTRELIVIDSVERPSEN